MMFGLFKRKSVTTIEQDVLKNIFNTLGEDYLAFARQIEEGLLKRVFFQSTPFKNYVGFGYDPAIASKYENKKGPYFVIRGIRVFDKKEDVFINILVYIAFGLIVGYSTPESDKPDFDPSKVQVDGYTKQLFDNDDYDRLSKVLSESERQLINSADVYEVDLKGKVLYHIKDLEDGDFIGVDLNKKVYKVTHDPFEVVELTQELSEVLSD
jgi:hypothetical protein